MMTDKAYIVANEQQEREVLEKLEREGLVWIAGADRPTEWLPSKHPISDTEGTIFPLKIINVGEHIWQGLVSNGDTDEEIVYDGRKESNMSEKYVVSQEFMNTLNQWREDLPSFSMSKKFVGPSAIQELDDNIEEWWNTTDLSDEENNNRLIAIIRWVNGEDVFEVEKPKKWVVRSKDTDEHGCYIYVFLMRAAGLVYSISLDGIKSATKFDTKEEAESWANSHQEVIEVEE